MSFIKTVNAEDAVATTARQKLQDHDVSKWFETETMTVSFGEYEGRPSADYTLKAEVLPRFLESGWRIVSVVNSGENGEWVETGGTTTNSTTTSKNNSESISNGDLTNTTSTASNGSTSTTLPLAEAPAHWHTWQTIKLQRRRLVPEFVMQTMTDDFAAAYNSGRAVEDERYRSVISLYTLMLDRSEKEGNEFIDGSTDLLPLAGRMADAVISSVEQSGSAALEVGSRSAKTLKADVNAQFDALVSQAKAKMVADGTYNGTVWPSVLAGIEKKRAEALGKAEESAAELKMNAYQTAASTGQVAGALLSAMQSVTDAADKRKVTAVELRNNVLKWMLDYIGSREETYPEVADLATVTERMGFSYASAGSVL